MLDLAWIREHVDEVRRGAERKHLPCPVDELLAVDAERRALVKQAEDARAEQNALGQQVRTLAGAAKEQALERLKFLKARVQEHQERLAPLERQLEALLLQVPNPPDAEVPEGKDDRSNVEVRRSAEPPTLAFAARDHLELMARHDMLDVERAGRLAGSRSYVLKGDAVLLEQAVLRLALDLIVARGYVPLSVPVVVKEWALRGTAYFPGAEEQTYKIANPTAEDDSSWLVGTSEVSVTALHGGEILDRTRLPLRYAGISPCFRREAGTYGKDTRGIYRVHQFQKVEQVVVCAAGEAESRAHHMDIVANAEAVLQALELPYRIVATAAGDIGRAATMKYDIEAWMPSRQGWGETHTASRFRDYQARRLDLRYRDSEGKVRHCWTLNNTVVASPRILIPLLEVHQQADGSIRLPAALRPYMGGREALTPR
ncbi:MAG: serine--tRNA ligase [Planctomycetia bacterium]